MRNATSGGSVFNLDREAERIDRDANARSTWTHLSTFAERGGKLMFFHGVSDPWFSTFETLAYYNRMNSDTRGAKADPWNRLYLVPGMGHCGGGSAALDRFDMLPPLVNWVEKNEAPQAVIATGNAFPGRSRPLCPYPEHAQYQGTGNSNEAASFTCEK